MYYGLQKRVRSRRYVNELAASAGYTSYSIYSRNLSFAKKHLSQAFQNSHGCSLWIYKDLQAGTVDVMPWTPPQKYFHVPIMPYTAGLR